jgi:hypothetical protein
MRIPPDIAAVLGSSIGWRERWGAFENPADLLSGCILSVYTRADGIVDQHREVLFGERAGRGRRMVE